VNDAHAQFRRGIQMALQGSFQEVAAQLTMEDAEMHATVGQCAAARSEAMAGFGLSHDNITLERASRALALCGGAGEALNLTSELAKRFPEATLTVRVALPVTGAALAMQRGEPSEALKLLEPVKAYDHAPSAEFWPSYIRGQAYLALKDGAAAGVQFQNILDHRGEVPASVLYPLAHLGLARAAALTSDTGRARYAYDSFLVLWRAGDSNLQPLLEARNERSRLR
jgi:hypothetical protein